MGSNSRTKIRIFRPYENYQCPYVAENRVANFSVVPAPLANVLVADN